MQYVFTAHPLNGGAVQLFTVLKPRVALTGLAPATQYEISVVGLRGGVRSPASNTGSFVTPALGGPVIVCQSLTTTTADVTIMPPPGHSRPWPSYSVVLLPLSGAPPLGISVACATPRRCSVSGLQPQTTYIATATGVELGANGTAVRSPSSNEYIFTTPPAPLLISAVAWGSTTGQAIAAGALGEVYSQVRGVLLLPACRGRATPAARCSHCRGACCWIAPHAAPAAPGMQWVFTAVPATGGSNTVVRNGAPVARFYALEPSTTYTVTGVGVLSDGRFTPAPNSLTFSTPSARQAG